MRHFARIAGATVQGAEARVVDVQVAAYVGPDLEHARFAVVGLPDSALREGKERIRSAVLHGGWGWPRAHLTVNLAPATARKEGAGLDLPIALGILAARRCLPPDLDLSPWVCIGELGLDGRLRPIRGALAAVEAGRQAGRRRALVPVANAAEAAAVPGIEVIRAATLKDAVGQVSGLCPLALEHPRPWAPAEAVPPCPVRGQAAALHAARIAAAGAHNLLLVGPPGSGKTLLARYLQHLLAPLTYAEALDVTRIHGIAGLAPSGLVTRRPFRAPHHSTSLAGLIGGGTFPGPGELSLAHHGVLFLDELPEFARNTLESLRQPMEDGSLVLGRASGRARLPTEVLLVAAMNPCPCGWLGVGDRCRCSVAARARYRRRISGPLRDRFDLQIGMMPVDPAELVAEVLPHPPAEALPHPPAEALPHPPAPGPEPALRRAWEAQAARRRRLGLRRAANARIPASRLPAAVAPTRRARALIVERARAIGLTGRGVHRVLRVARTIADLAGAEEVEEDHVFEALGLRGA